MHFFESCFVVVAASLAVASCSSGSDSPADSGSGGSGPGSGGGPSGSGGTASGGLGGVGVGASGGAGPVVAECTEASQCALINDCCSCTAIPTGEQPPACNLPECEVGTCTALGNPGALAACAVGRCVASLVCDHGLVTCKSLPPTCPAGQTPTVTQQCWGSCVPATQCLNVASCAQCTGGQACVKETTQVGATFHCVDPSPSCGDRPSCACMGETVCVGAFDACADGADGSLECSCPSC